MVNATFVRHYPDKVDSGWVMRHPREVPTHPVAKKMLRVLTGEMELAAMDSSMMSDEERKTCEQLMANNYNVQNPLPQKPEPTSYGHDNV